MDIRDCRDNDDDERRRLLARAVRAEEDAVELRARLAACDA